MNIIRCFCNYIHTLFKLDDISSSHIYILIHWLFGVCVIFITVFTTNITHLFMLLILISLDAFSIVVLHSCPLTLLEKKYLKINFCKEYKKTLRQSGINYKCNHEYEYQLELVMNTSLFIIMKLLGIMVFKTFHIKLMNHGVYE